MNNNSTVMPAAIIAGALILLLASITIAAILKYDTVDEALKVWSALSSIGGVVTGAVVTYFFKQGQVNAAESKAAEAKEKEANAKRQAHEIASMATELVTKHVYGKGHLPLVDLKDDADFKMLKQSISVLSKS